jgi:hypothetical protein
MPAIDLYTAEQVRGMGHPVPDYPPPYHIISAPLSDEVFIVSARLGKIWATANLGDSYDGVSLNDPAFRNRWTAGFIEIPTQGEQELREILWQHAPIKCEPESALGKQLTGMIRMLVDVHTKIVELQFKESCLVMTTNLRTLIVWLHEAIRLGSPHAGSTKGFAMGPAITRAAEDLWVDMVVPVTGDRTDVEARKKVMQILAQAIAGAAK